jgi:hypothetical protein
MTYPKTVLAYCMAKLWNEFVSEYGLEVRIEHNKVKENKKDE